MQLYSVSGRTTVTTGTQAITLASFRGDAVQRANIAEISIFTATGVAGGIGLARSTALAVTSLVSTQAVAQNSDDPALPAGAGLLVTGATTMATNGGIGTVFKRFTHPAAVGAGMVWTFDITGRLRLPLNSVATGEICFVNLNAVVTATYDISITFSV